MSSLLETRNLKAGYLGREVVRAVNLRVQPGEVVCLLGPNGAGKTTLLNTVAGLLRPAAGTVRLNGDDVTGRDPAALVRARLALVPERRRIFRDLTVEENLRLAGITASASANDATCCGESWNSCGSVPGGMSTSTVGAGPATADTASPRMLVDTTIVG